MIAAEGEQKASQALREAADVITQSPSAIQLRYLQVISFSGFQGHFLFRFHFWSEIEFLQKWENLKMRDVSR